MAFVITLRVDSASDVPAVRQITDHIRVLLVEHKLEPGTKLLSVRRLAMELGVHFNTVAEAYRQLASEGWLQLQHGRAARVLERSAPTGRKDWHREFHDRLRSLVAQMRAGGVAANEIEAELRAMAERMTR